MPTIGRIIDANGNRAREALRVMEEAARFILEDAELVADLKRARHELTDLVSRLGAGIGDRDTAADVGTEVGTPQESRRTAVADVVVAAAKRLGESLRALEEYGKLIDADVARSLEQLRYSGYELEQRLTTALHGGRAPQWRLCVLITESICRLPWRDVVAAARDAGADCFQLREKTLTDRELHERAEQMVACAGAAAVIIDDRPDIAVLVGADGVHLGRGDLPCAAARRIVGPDMLVGVSTSSLEEARAARRAGADYCGVGCMYPTVTKQANVVGPAYLRAYLEWQGLPHLAIGGIDAERAAELASLGARGVAVSSFVCGADDPGAASAAILAALSQTPE